MASKGSQTKDFILAKGLNFVSSYGFTDITIGKLAIACNMSRSGLFSHFKSKEQLQIDILKYAESVFVQTVIIPVKDIENPLKRVKTLCELWPNWVKKCALDLDGGCVFMSASFEYGHRPGEIRNYLLASQKKLLNYLEKVFLDGQKTLVFHTDISSKQMAFDFYSKYLGFHMYNNFLCDKSAAEYLEKSLLVLFESIQIK